MYIPSDSSMGFDFFCFSVPRIAVGAAGFEFFFKIEFLLIFCGSRPRVLRQFKPFFFGQFSLRPSVISFS